MHQSDQTHVQGIYSKENHVQALSCIQLIQHAVNLRNVRNMCLAWHGGYS